MAIKIEEKDLKKLLNTVYNTGLNEGLDRQQRFNVGLKTYPLKYHRDHFIKNLIKRLNDTGPEEIGRNYSVTWQRVGDEEVLTCEDLTVVQIVARLRNALKHSKIVIHNVE